MSFLPGADGFSALGLERISSIGPANPLPSFFFQKLGVEGSAFDYQGPFRGGLGEPHPILPSDFLEDAALWRDADVDGKCRSSPSAAVRSSKETKMAKLLSNIDVPHEIGGLLRENNTNDSRNKMTACYNPDGRVNLLPYTRQDMFGCERATRRTTPGANEGENSLEKLGVKTAFDLLTLESGDLRVQVVPELGGKVWSAYHKRYHQELFMKPVAIQPADYAIRKAWMPGGIEFNWAPGQVGHSVRTLEKVFAASVTTERGDILRLYDFDRLNKTVVQWDLFLDERGTLFVSVRVTNPNADADLNGYWWTNVAQKTTVEGRERIVLPAKYDAVKHMLFPGIISSVFQSHSASQFY